ncbi:MAG: sensor histidine kinase [Proteobacteria bacterium]|nr:sensor histidine kinase [Pseudomonadota bacterium]
MVSTSAPGGLAARTPSSSSAPDPDRSKRDRAVDIGLVLLALGVGLIGLVRESQRPGGLADGLLLVDLAVGSLACLALLLRRHRPVEVAAVLSVVAAFSVVAGGAAIIALFTVATRRRWRDVGAVWALYVAGVAAFYLMRPEPDLPFVAVVALCLVVTAAVVAWGMYLRARRQLVASLRDRAERAETEQQMRVEQARQAERARMAREMHDVLAHRISLLSMHAGALEFRPDAEPDEIAHAAGVIRENAHLALQDLREVIGVLREGSDVAGARPQPTLADVPALVEESRAAGLEVRADLRLAELTAVPAGTGRNVYRIVQEGLTNARKHAAGALVELILEGAPGAGLTVEVSNHPGPGATLGARRPGDSEIPGSGTGLIGLAERVTLASGRLEHGFTDAGDFRLRAWLPWPA